LLNISVAKADNDYYVWGESEKDAVFTKLSITAIVGQLTASAFHFDQSDGQSHAQKPKILSTVNVTNF
jgi:hypothetical protein